MGTCVVVVQGGEELLVVAQFLGGEEFGHHFVFWLFALV